MLPLGFGTTGRAPPAPFSLAPYPVMRRGVCLGLLYQYLLGLLAVVSDEKVCQIGVVRCKCKRG
jgi:hypothetical protein